MSGAARLSGACQCGAVRYEVDDAFDYAMNCHCSVCRRATGSAFKPMGGIRIAQFEVVSGQGNVAKFGSEDASDHFCDTCGSLLYSVVRNGEWVHVTYGTLADAPSRRPEMHIFVGSKAPWFEITDDLPQHDTYPGAD